MDDKLRNVKLNDNELDMVSGGTDDMIRANIEDWHIPTLPNIWR